MTSEIRWLGLDVGTKTIGVAVSDPTGLLASGVTTVRRTALEADLNELAGLVSMYGAQKFVVGYPRNMNGSVGEQARYVERFVSALQARFDLPVEYMDERLTSRLANQAMMAGNVRAEKRKAIIDQQAAALILQSALDRAARSRAVDPAEEKP